MRLGDGQIQCGVYGKADRDKMMRERKEKRTMGNKEAKMQRKQKRTTKKKERIKQSLERKRKRERKGRQNVMDGQKREIARSVSVFMLFLDCFALLLYGCMYLCVYMYVCMCEWVHFIM